jgi:hypothetical protein
MEKNRMSGRFLLVLLIGLLGLGGCLPAASLKLDDPDADAVQGQTTRPAGGTPGTLASSLLVTEWIAGEYSFFLYPLDPERGEALPAFEPISLGELFTHSLSPDRGMLAVASSEVLRLIDLENWEEYIFPIERYSQYDQMVFSADGRRLALISSDGNTTVSLFDLERGEIVAWAELGFLVSHIRFTVDSTGLMLYGTEILHRYTVNEITTRSPRVVLLDGDNLRLRWRVELKSLRDGIYLKDESGTGGVDISKPGSAIYYHPGVAFAPHHDTLYIVHADRNELTSVDFAAQKVITTDIYTPMTWFERLISLGAGIAHAKVGEGTSKSAVISADGQYLFVVGQESTLYSDERGNLQMDWTPLGLQVIRLADGARLANIDTRAETVKLSPDGGFLYLSYWDRNTNRTEVFDVARREIVAELEGEIKPALRVDGGTLLVSSNWTRGYQYQMRVIDPHSSAVLSEWLTQDSLVWLTTEQ